MRQPIEPADRVIKLLVLALWRANTSGGAAGIFDAAKHKRTRGVDHPHARDVRDRRQLFLHGALPRPKSYRAESLPHVVCYPPLRAAGACDGGTDELGDPSLRELVRVPSERYAGSTHVERARILDEFVAATGYQLIGASLYCHESARSLPRRAISLPSVGSGFIQCIVPVARYTTRFPRSHLLASAPRAERRHLQPLTVRGADTRRTSRRRAGRRGQRNQPDLGVLKGPRSAFEGLPLHADGLSPSRRSRELGARPGKVQVACSSCLQEASRLYRS
jgi:hypothetical protein